ncbi:DUF1488 domain-containing protein [Burkholderia seminalis]|uniref:DUF1488 domain-containing protein n=1 Tax=Burkholderia seminalis TaxID=488731 RepID=UPI00145431E8|nr:DUF1488 domain-containing protein [Burkholderia seminalis]MBJ9591327.1 DUF1488 domain-containing protein [Burkholderia seminalis]MCA8305317.1 DUF1488 domain-containing protein [Burkholderia seminalis]MCA8430651.1 DUF1488 domain-containing protein [Burkholderia seminalis]VWC14932.1 periplasmic protein [Burkholderia seminalis]
MPADSARHVTLTAAPPVFDGAALQLRFVVEVDGTPQTWAITVEALEDHFGARSALEADLRDAFERGRARIEAACADLLANGNDGDVVLHSGYFRAPAGRARAGLFPSGRR